MGHEPRTRHVALLVETSNAYGRGLLKGIQEYVVANPGWSLYLVEHSRLDTDLTWLDGWAGDGVLARIETAEIADFVRRVALPTVDLSAGQLVPGLPGVETNDHLIARWAVEHFVERGLTHIGFCSDPRYTWSVRRGAAVHEHAALLGLDAYEYTLKPRGSRAVDRLRLVQWLADLPRPVGILACYDIAGQDVLEACNVAGLRVPYEAAVLGVDNDELLATLSSPPLSSIEPDTRRTGFLAAQLLEKMMNGEHVEPGLRFIPPLRLVVRQSSDLFAVEDELVARALELIRERSSRHVTVEEIRRAVGLSRRALDLRFVEHLGRTAHAEITRSRMERVAHLLSTTDWTINRISQKLDFPHAESMGAAFKRYAGKSPGRYRVETSGSITQRGG